MELILKGDAKEIAALVLAVQERPSKNFEPEDSDGKMVGGINQKLCC